VNDKDLVARIPRSSRTNRLLQYEHVGRAVVVGNSDLGPLHIPPSTTSTPSVDSSSNKVVNSNTVEPDNDGSNNKVDFSILDRLRAEGTEVIQQWLNTGSRTNSSKTEESKLVQLSDLLLKSIVDDNWSIEEEISTKLNLVNTTATKFIESTAVSFPDLSNATAIITSLLASAMEPETAFIDKEVKLLQSILDGRALENHLEPSYYQALESVIITQLSSTNTTSDNNR